MKKGLQWCVRFIRLLGVCQTRSLASADNARPETTSRGDEYSSRDGGAQTSHTYCSRTCKACTANFGELFSRLIDHRKLPQCYFHLKKKKETIKNTAKKRGGWKRGREGGKRAENSSPSRGGRISLSFSQGLLERERVQRQEREVLKIFSRC